jgi:hypothetical protein
MKSRIREGAIILASAAVLLIASETFVRLLFPQDIRVDLQNGPPIGMNDRVLGHVNTPGAHAVITGPEYSAEYRVNASGMRDESPHPFPKTPGVTRILLLGDSFTWGAGVRYEDTWPVVFERACGASGNPVDVIKAGVSGYDTRQEVLYLERLFPIYSPDLVVIAFLPNDLFTNLPVAGSDSLESARAAGQDSLLVRNQGDKTSMLQAATLLKRMLISNDYLYTSFYFNTDRSRYFTLPKDARLEGQMQITKNLLWRAAEYCRWKGAGFAVLSIPQEVQVLMKARSFRRHGIDVDFIDNEFLLFAAEDGFEWFPALDDLAERYRSGSADLYYRLDGHLNAAGSECVGDFFFRRLMLKDHQRS